MELRSCGFDARACATLKACLRKADRGATLLEVAEAFRQEDFDSAGGEIDLFADIFG
jgi:hypothetical protein